MFISDATHCATILRRKPRPVLRTMLQMKGHGFQPKTNSWFKTKRKSDYVQALVEIWVNDPEKAQSMFDMVIEGQQSQTDNDILRQEIVGEVTDIQNAEKEALSKIATATTSATDTIEGVKTLALTDTREEIKDTIVKALSAINSSPDQLAERAIKQALEIVEKKVSEELNKYRPIEIRTAGRKVKLKDEVFCDQFERLIKLVENGVHVRMVGAAGCGKTHVAGQISRALGARAFAAVACSMGMSESQIMGRMLPTGKGGAFEYHASPFVDIYENGGVFLLDEMDAMDPNVAVSLNTALAGNEFSLPQRLGDPTVTRHPDFRLIVAMNTYGYGADAMYVGRNQLDEATLDRFKVGTVVMDYSDPIERSICAEAMWVYDWAKDIRQRIALAGLRRVMSTRAMKDSMTMVMAADWTKADLEKAYFADWTQDEINRLARAA